MIVCTIKHSIQAAVRPQVDYSAALTRAEQASHDHSVLSYQGNVLIVELHAMRLASIIRERGDGAHERRASRQVHGRVKDAVKERITNNGRQH